MSSIEYMNLRLLKADDGYFLEVPAHMWANSKRTQNFPIWALFPKRSRPLFTVIGKTTKRLARYHVPEGAIAIIRLYKSGSGWRIFYVVTIPELHEYVVTESNKFDTTNLPPNVRQSFAEFLEIYLNFGGAKWLAMNDGYAYTTKVCRAGRRAHSESLKTYIPAAIVRKLGMRSGDTLVWRISGNKAIIAKKGVELDG